MINFFRFSLVTSLFILFLFASSTAEASSIKDYQLPYGSNVSSITSGPDGNIWYTAIETNKIGKVTISGIVTEYTIPSPYSRPNSIVSDNNGNVWFTEFNSHKVARSTINGSITEYQLDNNFAPDDIILGPDNNMWFSSGNTNKIGRISSSGSVMYFELPASSFIGLVRLVSGSDGNIWFTESNDNQIGRITPTGVITEFTIPTLSSSPTGIALGPNNNIWFTEYGGNKIANITYHGDITEYPIFKPNVDQLTLGSDDALWYTRSNTKIIGKFQQNGDVIEYDTSGAVYDITSGPDGNIWFAQFDKISTFDPKTITNPLPSMIPTPPIGGASLNVPLFKQGVAPYNDNNPAWEAEEFDHANAGQFVCGRTMTQCGCATSSIAMILRYHGINKMPDGSDVNPGTVNKWLKENKGYNRNLGVIWSAVGNLAKKAKSQNPNFQYDALEYNPDMYFNTTTLTNDLNQGIPNILQVNAPGMHFVVAKGKTGNTFEINDPLFNRTTLASYNNQAVSVRRYIPSHTDLSYMVYVADKDVYITVRDENGATYGESYLEYSPAQLVEEPFNTNTSAVKVFYFAKPESSNYRVELYSATDPDYQLDEYIFTEEGEMKTASYTGNLTPETEAVYKLSYDKENINNIKTEPIREITFNILKDDIKKLYQQKQIKNVIFYTALKVQAEVAERATLINRQPLGNKLAIITLKAMLVELNKQKGKSITVEGYNLLYTDITSLINQLQGDQNGGSGSGGSNGGS